MTPGEALKAKVWKVTLFDRGKTFGPLTVDMGYPINEVEAAIYAMRLIVPKEGFTLNLRFKAEAVADA